MVSHLTNSPLFWHTIFAQNSALLKFVVFFYIIIMYLMYYLNEDGKRVYTLKVRKLYISKHRSLCEYTSQKLGFVSSFFLSLLEHTAEYHFNFVREFIVTKFTPRRPLSFPST